MIIAATQAVKRVYEPDQGVLTKSTSASLYGLGRQVLITVCKYFAIGFYAIRTCNGLGNVAKPTPGPEARISVYHQGPKKYGQPGNHHFGLLDELW